MWPSFTATGRGTSENAWRENKEKKTSLAFYKSSRTTVTGGLTSPERLEQLFQLSLAFCFSFQPMTAHRVLQDLFKVLLHVLFYL